MHTDLAAQYRAYFNAYTAKIEPLTAMCGAHAIDSAMGKEWFNEFKAQELALDYRFSTLQASHQSILNNDFQGIIKIFRFREEAADIKHLPSPILITPVFEAFSLPRKERGKSSFSAVCDTLIANRNRVHHLGTEAANAADAAELKSNISFLKKALLDCVTFLEYFKSVTDEQGTPYIDLVYREIEELEASYKNVRYHMLAVINNEGLDVTVERFAEICRELYITTFVIKDTYYFESSDYEGDLRAIKAIIKSSAPKKQSRLPIIISLIGAALILLILLLLLLPKDKGTGNEPDTSSDISSTVSSASNPSSPSSSEPSSATHSSDSASSLPASSDTASSRPAVVRINGSGSYEGLQFTVNQKLSNRLDIRIKNTDDISYRFGWTLPAEIVVETTLSTYFAKVSWVTVSPGGTSQLLITIDEDFEGDIESITIQNILPLNSSGLPLDGNTTGFVADIPITYER